MIDSVKDAGLKAMNTFHRTVVAVTGGKLGATMGSMPVFKVTTTGRVSGQPRTVLLTAPVHDDNQWVFVASKGGDDRHPDWYRNMVAEPRFQIEPVDGGDTITLVARTATAEEKAGLWPQIVAAYRGYDGYQARTDRDIPVILATPAAP